MGGAMLATTSGRPAPKGECSLMRLLSRSGSIALGVVTSAWLAAPAGAEEGPQLEAVYITQPPVLDGDLSDACWQQASRITDLKEMDSAGEPKEETIFWLGYDERYVYWAAYARDSQPDKIRADQKKRGGNPWNDDIVELDLDTHAAHKEAYWFVFNACGTQYEDIPKGSALKTEWRGDWEVAARIVEDGWVGEARIPFEMLRYPKGATSFCVIVGRRLAREDEWYTWPWVGPWDQEKSARWGPLELPEPKPRTCVMAHAVPEWNEGTGRLGLGLDARVLMPSGMVGQVAANPDFANIEQEVEGIDFTYTERYLGDARPFFTEGRGFYPPDYALYTRRLEAIDLGAKWFGRSGEHRLGVMDAWDFGHRHTALVNWCWDYQPECLASAFAVADDNEGELNTQYGAGWSVGEKLGDKGRRGVSATAYTTTVPGGSGSRERWKAAASYRWPDGRFYSRAGYERIEEGFAPAVAYFPESGIEGYSAGIGRYDEYRSGALRSTWWDASISDRANLGGGTYDRTVSADLGVATRSFWGGSLTHTDTERPPYHDRVESLWLWWSGDDLYRSGSADLSLGERQGGDYHYLRVSQGFKPSEQVSLRASASWLSHDAPEGHRSDRLLTLSANYDLDPEHSVAARLVDSDEGCNVYASYRQKVRRGTDLYVIVGDPNAAKTAERVAVKAVRTF
jgi:hypothetical protein